jgi:hypothetical protein
MPLYTVIHKHDYTANATVSMSGVAIAKVTIGLPEPSQSDLVMYKADLERR